MPKQLSSGGATNGKKLSTCNATVLNSFILIAVDELLKNVETIERNNFLVVNDEAKVILTRISRTLQDIDDHERERLILLNQFETKGTGNKSDTDYYIEFLKNENSRIQLKIDLTDGAPLSTREYETDKLNMLTATPGVIKCGLTPQPSASTRVCATSGGTQRTGGELATERMLETPGSLQLELDKVLRETFENEADSWRNFLGQFGKVCLFVVRCV